MHVLMRGEWIVDEERGREEYGGEGAVRGGARSLKREKEGREDRELYLLNA